MSQLFPPHNHPSVFGYKDSASVPTKVTVT